MKWQSVILAFLATICLVFAGNALAQTDININNTNLVRFGGSIVVPENQIIETVNAFGGNVTISANARVLDSATAFGGDVILQKGARVDGDVYSFGGKIIQEAGAVIGGETGTFNNSPMDTLRKRHGMIYGFSRSPANFLNQYFLTATFRVCMAIVAAIFGLIILQSKPKFLPELAQNLHQSPGAVAFLGIGAMFAFVFALIFLAITLIGIPLIPLLSLIAIITSLVGSLGVALFVGQRLVYNDHQSLRQQFLIGLAILALLSLLPFLGGLVIFLINLFGLGLVLLWRFGNKKPQITA